MSLLPRIGNKLHRMGRYLEKAENMAAYTRVHYMHYLDAAHPEYKDKLLESLLRGTRLWQPYFEVYPQLEEKKLLPFIAIEEHNSGSIRGQVATARELARASRDRISNELWEYINSFYHAMNSYTTSKLEKEGFERFAKKAQQFSLMIKGYAETSMLRDDRWRLLSLGFQLERTMQACWLLRDKMQEKKNGDYDERDQLIAMLKSIGSYEQFKQLYHHNISREEAIHFIAFNPTFPKSVIFNLQAMQQIVKDIGFYGPEEKEALDRQLKSLLEVLQLQHRHMPEGVRFLDQTTDDLQELAILLEQMELFAGASEGAAEITSLRSDTARNNGSVSGAESARVEKS